MSFAEGTRITLTAAETGEKVVVDGDRVIMCGDGRETVFTVKNHPDVFKNEEGGLALEADGLTVRHCNYTCWAHPFEGGNYDFAWRFDAQDDGTFVLFNWYAEDDAVFYLDICDGNAQITGNPRRWAVNVVG